MAELQARGSPLTVGSVRIWSDTVSALVQTRTSQPRSGLVDVLASAGLREDHAVALQPRSVTPDPAATREGALRAGGEVTVEVPPAEPGRGQVMLVDHGGALSWRLPERPSAPARSHAGPHPHRFRVPVAPPLEGDLGTSRGLTGALARRVLRVLSFDLVDALAGEVGDYFVRRWEEKRRPHRLRSFGPADYCDPAAPSLDGDAIRCLGGGPALLLIHGINSLTHSGFGALPRLEVEEMAARYEGRVFGFDHPTLSVDPLVNCQQLAKRLPDDVALEVDVLCHSRGGLVARTLVELADAVGTGPRLRVRQVVFVATPSLGTPLADPNHLGNLVDGLTNLLDLIPGNPVSDSLAGIVTVVKQLAVGAANGLDGLVAMCPPGEGKGEYLRHLNVHRPHGARYRAIAADYEPPRGSGLARVARDTLADRLFGCSANDLIVPTESTYSANGAQGFPISERLVLAPARSVDHSTFWTAPEVHQVFGAWLSADERALHPSVDRAAGAPSAAVDETHAGEPAAQAPRPVLNLRVLHASLEHSTYPVLVGHYRGDPIRGAEGHLDRRLDGQLSRRQAINRYPREIGDVLRITSDNSCPTGALVVGLGGSGELTPTGLARAVRDAALEHALGWLDQPDDRVKANSGGIGLSSVLMGSYGAGGMTVPAAVAAIVEGVVLANGLLAERAGADLVRIGELEIVERYSEPAEDATRILSDIGRHLPAALQSTTQLQPHPTLDVGEGGRPALPTAEYGAGMWHRLIVSTRGREGERTKELHFTSLGTRARADQLVQEVDTEIVGRMVRDAVVQETVDPRVNIALYELLLPTELKRELAAVDNLQLVLDDGAADLPWEAVTDRGALTGAAPLSRKAGLLRQLSVESTVGLDVAPSSGGALVIGDPPGGPDFGRLSGARREAEQVAEALSWSMDVEAQIYRADEEPPDSASRVLRALFAADYQVIHIAGHGHFEPAAGEGGRATGGVVIGPGDFLTAAMVSNMQRPPDLVFLNCCHLGSVGGRVLDDPMAPPTSALTRHPLNQLAASLSRELMKLGVKAVVAAGWRVSDEPAAAFARVFYEAMLAGSLFGDAVRWARDAAFDADGGTSNTWAAYQCYGDPAFRLTTVEHAQRPRTLPVSADELVRRLEEISVAAGDVGGDDQAEHLRQVSKLDEMMVAAWRGGRVLGALGDAYAVLGSLGDAIASYREAMERGDSQMCIRVVEQLAVQEHNLAMVLRENPDTIVTRLDPRPTEADLRQRAIQRLDALDALGRSGEREALRGGWYKREAVMFSRLDERLERAEAIDAAAQRYASAWDLDQKPYGCFNALQLAALGAELPPATRADLEDFLRADACIVRPADFWTRTAPADRRLTLALVDGCLADSVDEIAAAYRQIFKDRSRPSERNSVIGHVEHLAQLAEGAQKTSLERLRDLLRDPSPNPAMSAGRPS